MTHKSPEEEHEEELQQVIKETLKAQEEQGTFTAFDPEALLKAKKETEENAKVVEPKKSRK